MTSSDLPLPLPPLPEAPLVSVLMPNYNYARFIGDALDSVQAQAYAGWEVIVCDDGSTDSSRAVVERYLRRDGRIRLLPKDNGGVASALNAAFREAQGEILCLLDADDTFLPGKVDAVVEGFRRQPGAGMLTHAMQVVDAAGTPLHRIPTHPPQQGWIAEAVRARGGRWRSMPASALCFRRTLADHLFPIPEETFRSEADGFLVALAPLLARVGHLAEPLSTYRLHGANLTGTRHLDAAVARRHLDARRRICAAVNARLRTLVPDAEPLTLMRHLNVHEHRATLCLLEGAPCDVLWAALGRLGRGLLRDDLYHPVRKVLGLVAYGLAPLVPVRWRAAWLSHVLHARPLRRGLELLRGHLH